MEGRWGLLEREGSPPEAGRLQVLTWPEAVRRSSQFLRATGSLESQGEDRRGPLQEQRCLWEPHEGSSPPGTAGRQ